MIQQFLKRLVVQLVLMAVLAGYTWAAVVTPDQMLQLDYLEPANYLIEDIQIVGNQELESEALLPTLNIQAGDVVTLPGPGIDELMKKIWQQKLVQDLNLYVKPLTTQSVVLIISITESPRLAHYTLEGLKRKDRKALQEVVTLEKGKIVTDHLLLKNQKKIQQKLVSQGYLNAQVHIAHWPDPELAGYVQVSIQVDKGEKFIVNKIHIKGNEHIDADVLKANFKHIKEKPRFTLVKDMLKKTLTLQPLRKGGALMRQPDLAEAWIYLKTHVIPFATKFIKSEYEVDKKTLISYYQSQGYSDAVIVADTVYQQSNGLLNIMLQVEEGQQYRLGNIKWVGNYLYEAAKLNQVLNIKKGAIYNPQLLHERLYANPTGLDVATLYMDKGYLFFQAEPVEVYADDGIVDIEIRLQEGPQATINQVHIKGNTITHDHVIRRELKTLPGDKFSRSKVQRSLRELNMLNIFDPAIKFTPVPNPANQTVDLNYGIKDKPKFEIRAGGAWGGSTAFTVSLLCGTNNLSLRKLLRLQRPLGDAQTINLKAAFQGKRHQNLSLQFIEPWFGGKKPTTLTWGINKSFERTKKDSHLDSFGVRTGLASRLKWPDDYFVLRGGLHYVWWSYADYVLIEGKGNRSGHIYDLHFDTSIERNSLNDPVYPTTGSEVGLHVKLTPPYSLFSQEKGYQHWKLEQKFKWKEYHQWIADASYFQQIWGDWVANLRGHIGIVGAYSAKRGIGPFERFAMGGTALGDFSLLSKELITLRGYPDEYILPKDKKHGYEGGTIFDKFVFELRHPIVKSALTYIYALAFVEAGNTWLHYQDWRPFELKPSTGLGVRIYSPFGLIGLDWGYGFAQKQEDKIAFNWSFGTNAR